MEIRDFRNGDWHWVNNALTADKHLSPAEKTAYGAICTFAGCAEIHPSYETIAERSALSVRTCKMAVQKLIAVGYLEVEKGGGKGNANVYKLVKAMKGCKKCTVSNGAKNDTQTVQSTTANGAKNAPQLDKELDNEEDIAPTSGAEVSRVTSKKQFNPQGAEIIKALEEIDPKNKTYYGNKTQRAAADFLIAEYGLEEVLRRIPFLKRTNGMPYIPKINSPYDLKEKWVKLEDALKAKRVEVEISKPRIAFV